MNIEKIHSFNPWFDDTDFRYLEKNLKKRFIFDQIKDLFRKNFIITLSGLRRTGKTTLLRQVANYLLDENKALFYYQFDEDDNNLDDILKYLFDVRLKEENLYETEVYILLDELQFVANWQKVLKHYYDINKNIQFIATGSASLYLNPDVKESLVGRVIDLQINPLFYDEFLYIKFDYKSDIKLDLLEETPIFIDNLKKRTNEISIFSDYINDYLIKGEFPELVNYSKEEYNVIRNYLEDSVVNNIFKKDIKIFEISKTRDLKKLYRFLLSNAAQFISYETISLNIELSRPTVKNYLDILKKAYLVNILKNKLRSIKGQEKSYNKIFSSSINLIASSLAMRDFENYVYSDFKGHIVENYIFNFINSSVKNIDEFHYFNKDKKEVDFVISAGENIVPIEVKYKNKIKKTDLNHLYHYMEKTKLSEGICFYRGENHIDARGDKKVHLINWI